MSRQGKNIHSTTKRNRKSVKYRDPTIARLKQTNINEAEENNLKK